MDIETLQKQNADLLLALRQLSDAARPFTCGSIVDETSGTIPLMGKLGEVLAHADSLAADTRPAANAGGLSPGPAAGRELAGYFALQDGEWHPSNADDPCSVKLYKNARSPAALAAGQSAGTALGKALDKMEVIAQVVESERLTNTANALRGLIEQVRTVDRAPDTSAAGRADWKRFALAVLIDARDNLGSDVDGGMIQDCATECGLLVKVSAQEPCGPFCACDESGDFPQDCYRYSDETRKAIAEQNDTRPAKGAAGLEGGAA